MKLLKLNVGCFGVLGRRVGLQVITLCCTVGLVVVIFILLEVWLLDTDDDKEYLPLSRLASFVSYGSGIEEEDDDDGTTPFISSWTTSFISTPWFDDPPKRAAKLLQQNDDDGRYYRAYHTMLMLHGVMYIVEALHSNDDASFVGSKVDSIMYDFVRHESAASQKIHSRVSTNIPR